MSKFNLLENFDSGSNYKFGDKMNKENNPRSLFDLSHLVTMTIPNCGYLIPVTYFECLPGDDHYITADALMRVMPQVVPLYSRQRLLLYAFYSRYSDLWNNWQVFIDKGYTGTVKKTIPILKHGNNVIKRVSQGSSEFSDEDIVLPDSLLNYLGLPVNVKKSSLFGLNNSSTNLASISCLPWMMYLRIYRDYFMNKDEWINDRVILPDDDSRFRVDDDGRLLSAKDQSKGFYFSCTNNDHSDLNDLRIIGNNYYIGLLFHDYPNDYFTSAKPFTQRGEAGAITKTIDTSLLGIDFDDQFGIYSNVYGLSDPSNIQAVNAEGTGIVIGTNAGTSPTGGLNPAMNQFIINQFKNHAKITGSNVGIKISIEDIRKAAIDQIELEQMARTDGSYAQFGLTFFGEISKAAHDYRPTFIGGTYKNISFTEVLQQSGSTVPTTAESGSSPLGAYAGHGITGITNGEIGRIHCDDYGMIMIIACIMPDIYYSQGLDRILTDNLQADKYLPDRAKLGMQPIYNKELYYAGNNGSDVGDDNYLWAYQSPFDYLRYIPNKIRGKIADPNNRSFRGYTQSRIFDQLVNWGRGFSEANNVRKDYLFAPSEDAYTAQFSFNIRTVRELPYKAIPAQIV